MDKLRRFDLSKDDAANEWVLKEQGSERARKRFQTKGEATAKGVIEAALGARGGSVRIRKENGQIQEERTYPRSRDPRSSEG